MATSVFLLIQHTATSLVSVKAFRAIFVMNKVHVTNVSVSALLDTGVINIQRWAPLIGS